MFTLNLIVSKRKKKNHLQQQSKKNICNGTETHVSMPSTMGKGIYVVSVETKQGISSRKLVVR